MDFFYHSARIEQVPVIELIGPHFLSDRDISLSLYLNVLTLRNNSWAVSGL